MLSAKRYILNYCPLVVILFLAAFLYFYQIKTVPNGFYIDEALPAYNAYSILRTAKDEYGKFLPIVFRFYGSYNPALYTYLTVIPVYLFGLGIFSARFMSLVAGLIFPVSVYLFFLSSGLPFKKWLASVGAIVAAFSPWLIFYSRIGYEVTLGLMLFSFGAYFLWKALKNSSMFIWAMVFLSASTYAAYTQRFIAPLLVISFAILYRETIFSKKFRKKLIKGVITAFLIEIPNLCILFTPAFFPKTSLLALSSLGAQAQKLSRFIPPFLALILAWLREFLSQYFSYFSPTSLFFLSDPDLQRSIPAVSVFYSWMVIPYLVGGYYLWRERKNNFVKYILLLLLITPIPAAVTRDPFSSHRALPLILPLVLLISFGIIEIKNHLAKSIFWPLAFLTILVSGVFFWRSYFVFFPKERAFVWQYGYEQLAEEIQMQPNEHFIIDQARLKPIYINLAFFLKYPPNLFQESVDQNIKSNYYSNLKFDDHYVFGQIETRNINWEKDIYQKQILVGDEYSISEGQAKEHFLTKIFEIRDPLDKIIFEGYQTHPELLVK